MKKSAEEVLKSQDEYIACWYFNDLENPTTCKTCAVGELIRNLPEPDFQECVTLIKDNKLNGKSVEQEAFAPVLEKLLTHYDVDLRDLQEIQTKNDVAWPDPSEVERDD